jgi:hypothetical protein
MAEKKMYGNTAENLQNTLSQMIQESWAESNCSMDATYQLTRQKLDYDRRFDGFDKQRLVDKAKEVGASGGKLDLTDPYLRGGDKRPLSDRGY